MCTAISYKAGDHYFGRNLDVEFSFNEQAVITPRGRLFRLSGGGDFYNRYALIGIAAVVDDYPLYYEAANEAGLAAAGLNFPGNAVYLPPQEGKRNISPSEFLPWLLGQAESVREARELLKDMVLTNIPFKKDMPLSPLHFMISDRDESIVAEPTAEGLKIYDNPYKVMTNNPPFDFHLWNLHNYLNCSVKNRESAFSPDYQLNNSGVGMGAFGLPGDASSPSRFVKAAFTLTNSPKEGSEEDCVSQFFHVLDSVAMLKGSTLTDSGKDDITLYSCCINTDRGIFYYKTYGNSRISAVRLTEENMNADSLKIFPLLKTQDILFQN